MGFFRKTTDIRKVLKKEAKKRAKIEKLKMEAASIAKGEKKKGGNLGKNVLKATKAAGSFLSKIELRKEGGSVRRRVVRRSKPRRRVVKRKVVRRATPRRRVIRRSAPRRRVVRRAAPRRKVMRSEPKQKETNQLDFTMQGL